MRYGPLLALLVAFSTIVRAQATWDFTAGTGAPTSLPANVTGGVISATNGTIAFNTSSASTGYTGASGGNNAVVGAGSGSLSTSTSSFFELTLNATTGNRLFASAISLGSRSTSSGPTTLTLYSSADSFATALGTATVSTSSSNWALVTFSNLALFSSTSGSLTFRLYGSGGSGGSGNWRIDDVVVSVISGSPGPVITTQPATQNLPPGATASLSVVAAGTGPVSYAWQKGGVALNTTTYPSAATAGLNLGIVSSADTGSYDVIVTDSLGHVTSSAAQLTVAITPVTITLGALSATYDGNPHAITATTNPPGISAAITYAGQASAPTNAGSYAVAATITDPAYTGSATGTLVISPAVQTISFTTNPGYAPAGNVPFTVSATASSSLTPVRFAIASGNATATGTNNSTISVSDTSAVAIHATQAGDANNTATASSPDLVVTAAAPAVLSGTYTQTFDSLGTALPAGWHVFTGAAATALGTDVSAVASSLVLAGTDWNSATGNFRNVASALNGGATSATDTSTQAGFSNRALGVRQGSSATSPFGDPGAAFAFNFATTGVNVTSISFSAQILSAQANVTTWLLQSAPGANPTSWTTLATFNDPGVFGATTISVTPSGSPGFGTALNNQASVWLRVVALGATSFGGTRDTFAIDNFTIATGPRVSVTTAPAALTRTSGQAATFSVSATGTGTLTYQWRKNGTPIPSATSSTLNLASVATADAGSYDVIVSDTVGSTTSTAAILTVNKIATTITLSNLSVTYDGSPHAAVATPAPSGATVAFTYAGAGITPYTSSSTAPTNVGSYQVTATTVDSEHQGTATGTLVVNPDSSPGLPIVATAPVSQSVAIGVPVMFSVEVTGSPAPTVQWRKDGVPIPGATGPTYTILAVTPADAGLYDVVVANGAGTTTSRFAALVVGKNPQTIAFDPVVTHAAAGASLTLTATASSNLPVTFTIISGAGTISGNFLTGTGATVIVRANQTGDATYAAAEPVDRTFTFVAGGLSPFLTSAPADQTVAAGTAVTFHAAAIGTPAPAFQWQKDGVAIAGATSSTLALASATLADAGRYTVIATNLAGTATASAALVVRAAPVITTPPADQTVAAGSTVTLAVTAAGFPAPTYQWRKNGVAIAGATAATLPLGAVTTANAGRYDVVATNTLGTMTSAAATLVVATRDFSGDYFGRFGGASGDFALHLRDDGTGVFLGYLPGAQTGFATLALKVDLAGNFTLGFSTLAGAEGTLLVNAADAAHSTAAAPQTVTLRGSLDETAGTLSATIAELSLTLAGTRTAATGIAAAQAGFYQTALLGSASGRGYVIVAPDGQALVLTASGTTIDGAAGTIGANGRLALTTPAQAALDLGFSSGAVSGTIRTGTTTSTIAGAADELAGTEHLVNVSIRSVTGPGTVTLITGFVVSGSASKQLLIRVAGPAIAAAPFNVAGALTDPALQVFRGSARVAQNDDWGTPASGAAAITAAAVRVGAFPFRTGSADAALLTTLTPGAYTVQVTGDGPGGAPATGIALTEIYEVLDTNEAAGTRRLVNLSARGIVSPGAPLIAGFVITGTAPQRVLVRGVGPTLAAAPINLAGALANPQLTLFNGATAVKTNDDWFRDADATQIRDAATKVGAFALGASSADGAMLLYLAPGAYTAQVSGPATGTNGTGLALVEIYEVAP